MTTIPIFEQLTDLKESMCVDAIDIAGQHCNSTTNESSCTHYHGIRFLLQRLGNNASMPPQYEVFYSGIKSIFETEKAQGQSLNVLISAAADFIVPALVSSALHDLGITARVTIVDLCETPLKLCEIAAEKFHFDWHYQQSNILDIDNKLSFDLIVTDRLFGHIPPEVRPELLNKLASLLSNDGRFITMTSFSGPTTPGELAASLKRVQLAVEKCKVSDRYSLEQLLEMVNTCITIRNRYPIKKQIILEQTFEASRLTIQSITPVQAVHLLRKEKGPAKVVKLIAHSRN